MPTTNVEQQMENLTKVTDLLKEAELIHNMRDEKAQAIASAKVPYERKREKFKEVADEIADRVHAWVEKVDTYARVQKVWTPEETWQIMSSMKDTLEETLEQSYAIIN
jgi:carbonic anhydrase